MKILTLAILSLTCLATQAVHAQLAPAKTNEQLKSTLVMQRVIVSNGKEVLEAAPTVKPGETIEYVATFTNVSAGALKQIQAVIPVPFNTELIAGSESGGALASLDGTKFDVQPLKRKKKTPAGAEVEEIVPAKEYRSLRWSVAELAPGQSVTYKARVKVRDDRT